MSMDFFYLQPHSDYLSGREPNAPQEEPQHT
jgi:hypothetical protein